MLQCNHMITHKLKSKDTIKGLKGEIKKVKGDDTYALKLRALVKVRENPNRTRKEIAKELVISEQALITWIKLYNEQGKKGLKTNKGGRPKGKTKWDNSSFEKLSKQIDKSDHYWSIRLMQEWLEEHEDVCIPKTTLWYRMIQIGYSNKSSRPYPYKGDSKKQEEFKKRALNQ